MLATHSKHIAQLWVKPLSRTYSDSKIFALQTPSQTNPSGARLSWIRMHRSPTGWVWSQSHAAMAMSCHKYPRVIWNELKWSWTCCCDQSQFPKSRPVYCGFVAEQLLQQKCASDLDESRWLEIVTQSGRLLWIEVILEGVNKAWISTFLTFRSKHPGKWFWMLSWLWSLRVRGWTNITWKHDNMSINDEYIQMINKQRNI